VGGSVWGLGLARLWAEAGRLSALYAYPVVVGLVALGGAVVAVGLWRWLSPVSSPAVRPISFAVPLALPALYVLGVVAGPLAGGVLLIGGAALAALEAATVTGEKQPLWVLPALLGLVTLALDLRTLLPSIGEADTLEFQVVAAKLGVAHPTGYPLYILLAKLFTWLPLNNVAWRVNLSSAVFAAVAVAVLYRIVRRMTDRPVLSFLTALAFAFSHTFWSQSVIAEVYTLHNLLVAVILWLLLREGGVGKGGGTEKAAVMAGRWQAVLFLIGLSLTNHLTTVLLVPAAALALVWDRPRLGVRGWLVAGGLFVLGLAVYLYIPLRWPALHDGRWMTPPEFVAYVTGRQFHGALRLAGWRDPTRWRIVGRLLGEPFGWIGLGLAALGVVNLASRYRRALALTVVTFVAFLLYGLVYAVADIAVFLLPAHLVLAIWMGSGVTLLDGLLSSLPPLSASRAEGAIWRSALATAFALMPLSRIWINLPAVDRSRDPGVFAPGGYAWGQYVLSQELVEGGAILADPKKFAPLYYLQQVEGMRPDLDMVLLGSEDLYQADLRRRLGAGQTVYLARYLPHLEALYLRSVGPLAEVHGEPPDATRGTFSGLHPAAGDALGGFEVGIDLLGADVEEDPLGRALHHVTLHWQAETAVEQNLVVGLRLVDADGDVRWRGEGGRPVNGLYPTNAWRPGVPVSDYHEVAIPAWLPPGPYVLEVGLFAPFGHRDAGADEDSTAWLSLQRLDVEPPSDPEPLSEQVLYGLGDGVWLTGFDAPNEITAGAPFVVDLAWRGVGEEERVQLWWAALPGLPGADSRAGEARFDLTEGMLRSRHTIAAPTRAGGYALRVGLGDGETVAPRARCGWLTAPESSCSLIEVQVLSKEAGLASFGERILLLDAVAPQDRALPGDVVQVTLRWRGLRAMATDYTVFVHLVGPDGRLHGQTDSWPVEGTFPTSQWVPGREISDPYAVRLEADAPPGTYRVEVGLYDLATMERLQIMDGAGKPIGDSLMVSTFEASE
jgi:hypothetical protein